MSRIGKKPIPVPQGVTVTVQETTVAVKGPKGAMTQALPPGVHVEFDKDAKELRTLIPADKPGMGKFHGLARSLVANAVLGVTDGYKRELDIVGVGYRAELKGREVHFALGLLTPGGVPDSARASRSPSTR